MIIKFLSFSIVLFSFHAQANTKHWECSSFVESTPVKLTITHHVDDFRGQNSSLQSAIVLSTPTMSYSFNEKLLADDYKTIDFTTSSTPPNLDNTSYRISELFLYDAIPDLEQDDYFFGKLTHTNGGQNKYFTDFDRMVGDLVVLFRCVKNKI